MSQAEFVVAPKLGDRVERMAVRGYTPHQEAGYTEATQSLLVGRRLYIDRTDYNFPRRKSFPVRKSCVRLNRLFCRSLCSVWLPESTVWKLILQGGYC